jgi:hypothetical protein
VLLAWIKQGDDHSKATRAEICRPRWRRWLANQAVFCSPYFSRLRDEEQDGLQKPVRKVCTPSKRKGTLYICLWVD